MSSSSRLESSVVSSIHEFNFCAYRYCNWFSVPPQLPSFAYRHSFFANLYLNVILQTGTGKDPNNNIMELLILCYACKTASARRIIGVIPYLPYCKQSKVRLNASVGFSGDVLEARLHEW